MITKTRGCPVAKMCSFRCYTLQDQLAAAVVLASQPVKSAEMGKKDSRRADFVFARKEEFITPRGLASECSTEGLKASGPEHIPHIAPSQKNQSRIALLLKPPKKADQLDLPPRHTQQGQSWWASGGQGQESHLSLLPAHPFSPLFPQQTQAGIMHPFHRPGKESLAGADMQSLGSKALGTSTPLHLVLFISLRVVCN